MNVIRNRSTKFNWLMVLGTIVGLHLLGCGAESKPDVSVTGTVTVKAKPLSGAVITLEPIAGTTGPNASAPIFDGKFEIKPSAGLHGGKYLARVSMIPAELRSRLPADQSKSLPPEDAVIAPRYDLNSTLECELSTDQTNELEFVVEFL